MTKRRSEITSNQTFEGVKFTTEMSSSETFDVMCLTLSF